MSDDLPAERKLKDQLIKVSAFTRYRTIHKETIATLFIDPPQDYNEGYSISQIISMFPPVPDRKMKVLSNLQGLSRYWGDAIEIGHEDFPIFFPEVPEEQPSLMMMKVLVDEGLVSGEVKFPTQLTVTDKGSSLLSDSSNLAPQVPAARPIATITSDKMDGLHPKVLAIAKKLFDDGHYRSAVLDTYVALNNEVQKKSGLQLDGSSLMQKAFSKDAPVLKVPGGEKPQMGALWLFTGSMMGVRNILAHNHTVLLNEQEALEWLNFASALFRTLELSVNVEKEKLMDRITQLKFVLDGKESSDNIKKIEPFITPVKEYADSNLYRAFFLKLLEILKSPHYQDQNAGVDFLLKLDSGFLDQLTKKDHIELVSHIYKEAGYAKASRSAVEVIRSNFKSLTKSLKVFQDYLLSNTDSFNVAVEKVWFRDTFFELIVNHSEEEFLVAFLSKIVNKELELTKTALEELHIVLKKVNRMKISEHVKKITKMVEEFD